MVQSVDRSCGGDFGMGFITYSKAHRPSFDHPCDRDIGVSFIRYSQASGTNDCHFHEKTWMHQCNKVGRRDQFQLKIADRRHESLYRHTSHTNVFIHIKLKLTEQASIAVTLEARVQVAPGSQLCRDTRYPGILNRFHQCQANRLLLTVRKYCSTSLLCFIWGLKAI